MIAEHARCIVVLHLTDALLTQLRPFTVGLAVAATPRRTPTEQAIQQLTMPGAVYDALVERVGGALDYDLRWRPDQDEPEGFVERVQPLALTDGTLTQSGCSACGTRVLANCLEVQCVCGQALCLRSSRDQG
jgi:hypothetical protein